MDVLLAVVQQLGVPVGMLAVILWYAFPWLAGQLTARDGERREQAVTFLQHLTARDVAREQSQMSFLSALRERDDKFVEVVARQAELIHAQTEKLAEIRGDLRVLVQRAEGSRR